MNHTFHVISLPHTNVTAAFSSCAFTQKVRRFCQMMRSLGHTVILYAGQEIDIEVDEHVVCTVDEDERKAMVGDRHYTEADWGHPLWPVFNERVVLQMRKRIQQRDFICLIGGYAQKPVADAFPEHISVEFGIGYAGTFAKFRVFESYAWMHMIYGADTRGNAGAADGNYFDAVIPNQIDDELYDFNANDHANYALYVGRMIDRKGYQLAQEVCEEADMPLKLAGPGADPGGYGQFLGEVSPKERTNLMRGAACLFVPTQYVEPFGTVHIEALAAGCPVLSTDWGVFTETITNGWNGQRCRSFQDYLDGVDWTVGLSVHARYNIARRARAKYSMKTVAGQYEDYFNRLSSLWGLGFYERRKT